MLTIVLLEALDMRTLVCVHEVNDKRLKMCFLDSTNLNLFFEFMLFWRSPFSSLHSQQIVNKLIRHFSFEHLPSNLCDFHFLRKVEKIFEYGEKKGEDRLRFKWIWCNIPQNANED